MSASINNQACCQAALTWTDTWSGFTPALLEFVFSSTLLLLCYLSPIRHSPPYLINLQAGWSREWWLLQDIQADYCYPKEKILWDLKAPCKTLVAVATKAGWEMSVNNISNLGCEKPVSSCWFSLMLCLILISSVLNLSCTCWWLFKPAILSLCKKCLELAQEMMYPWDDKSYMSQ